MPRNMLLTVCLSLLVGCASTSSPSADPWESLNRGTFAVNEALDDALLKPLAKGYQLATPAFVRVGVSNAFGNVADVGTGVNNLLQGKPSDALADIGRVVVNTTLGVLGLFDVATPMGLDKRNEDFGQTLGTWGVASGPYLVLPLLGPSTLRDGLSRIPESRSTAYSRTIDDVATRNTLTALNIISIRAQLLATTKTLDEASLDKYQFLRDAFLQWRLHQVYDGNVPQAVRDKLEEDLEVSAVAVPPSKAASPR